MRVSKLMTEQFVDVQSRWIFNYIESQIKIPKTQCTCGC